MSSISETPVQFSQRIKINFNNYLLLERALTHRSYVNEHPEAMEDNERLEFLGDAVLDFIVGDWLYNKYPEMPEGDLTQMRSALVQTSQLAEFAKQIQIGKALRLGHGEAIMGGRLRNTLLCDAFEAFIGALYLEKGLELTINFMVPFLSTASDEILALNKNEDPKSKLQEWAQSLGYPPPCYTLQSSSGPDHLKTFDVIVYVNQKYFGSGSGHSKQEAAKEAAKEALMKIKQNN